MTDAPNIERRLAAVAFADVAGYSRMIELDDVDTMLRWRALRNDLIGPKIDEHRGRLIRMAGDGLFIEFRSAVDAVQWAQDVQRGINQLYKTGESRLLVRIGINVEDVIIDGDDLHGDGVNIAARIQQIAEPGEIVVTSNVYDYVWNKVGAQLVDLGERSLKNISRPIHIFRLDAKDEASGPARRVVPHIEWTNRPSIAVLPFRNVGGRAEENYFGEGITEDIIAALSRSRSMYVIARNSTLAYREQAADPWEIAGQLGVRYILQGAVRRQDERLRISVELVDASHNRTIWAEKYDGLSADLFDFQDRIAASIVATVEPRLVEAEAIRARQKPTERLDAYDCVLRALSLFYTFDKAEFSEAGAYLDQAIELDPSYAQAHAYKAWWYVLRMAEGALAHGLATTSLAEAASRRAMTLDDHDAFVVSVAGHVESIVRKQPEVALELFDRALLLNENSAFAWGLSSASCAYLGEAEKALERLRSAWRLSPFDPLNFMFLTIAGIAEFVAGRYDPAIAWLNKARRTNPRFVAALRTLVTSLSHAGRAAEARAMAMELLEVEPNFSVGLLQSWYPFRRPDDLERYLAGLREAGLPE
ncbi:MAG TPA: adenylate/guanylate cyclase domain-containing protein [Casimicrobiaceae bacterium]|nr:adenylate/guanylate cyclase domain-containing protein [Casimicrobiaceae bacterium]